MSVILFGLKWDFAARMHERNFAKWRILHSDAMRCNLARGRQRLLGFYVLEWLVICMGLRLLRVESFNGLQRSGTVLNCELLRYFVDGRPESKGDLCAISSLLFASF